MNGDGEGAPLAKIGSVIGGKYRVDAELGRGGMGVVVRATHLHLNQSLAIKFLLRATRPGAAARFEREARTTMRLRSEHTVRVLDAGVQDGIPYLVMELLDGCDLRRLIRERGALPVGDAAGYVVQACEALAEAHALGIVHRDVKPANLFLTRRFDGSPLIKVLDFGVAKECTEEADLEALTTSAVALGSPMYMSPEQVRDARMVDARADLWSTGVTLFELLTGRGPFEAATVSGLLAAVLSDEPASLHALCPSAPPRSRGSSAPASRETPRAAAPRRRSSARPWAPSPLPGPRAASPGSPASPSCRSRTSRCLRSPGPPRRPSPGPDRSPPPALPNATAPRSGPSPCWLSPPGSWCQERSPSAATPLRSSRPRPAQPRSRGLLPRGPFLTRLLPPRPRCRSPRPRPAWRPQPARPG